MTPGQAALATVAVLTLTAVGDVVHACLGVDQGTASGIASMAALSAVLGTAAMAARAAASDIGRGRPRDRRDP